MIDQVKLFNEQAHHVYPELTVQESQPRQNTAVTTVLEEIVDLEEEEEIP